MQTISVVIPIYNISEQLHKCIDSALKQTYKQLEIILVDDGSTDNSGKICDEYSKKDARIKVIHKKNGGLSDARNVGISKSHGKYIFLLDGDDYIEFDCIEYLFNIMQKEKSDIACCGYVKFFENQKPKAKNGSYKSFTKIDALERLMYQKNITTSAWGKLYKKELFQDIQYPKGAICEDLPTTYRLFSKSKRITISNAKKYFYLQRPNSIIHSSFNLKRYDAYSFAKEETKFIQENYPKIIKSAQARECMEAIYIISAMTKEKEKYREQYNEMAKVIKTLSSKVLFDRKTTIQNKALIIRALLKNHDIIKY